LPSRKFRDALERKTKNKNNGLRFGNATALVPNTSQGELKQWQD
jgi:hypothetical protein